MRSFVLPVVLVLLGVFVLAAAPKKQKSCEACTADAECAQGLRCDAEQKVCQSLLHPKVCPEDCATSKGCAQSGSCHYDARLRLCAPKSEEDCRHSLKCRQSGRCHLDKEGSSCVAASTADCAASEMCKDIGLCTFKDEVCDITSDADCRLTSRCASDGACRLSGDKCVPKWDGDCEHSDVCRQLKWCKFDLVREACGPAKR